MPERNVLEVAAQQARRFGIEHLLCDRGEGGVEVLRRLDDDGTPRSQIDAQAGMESGASAIVGALAGINMISGAGMLDFLACHSIEKLVIDAEAIASAQRMIAGIEARTEQLALGMFALTGIHGEFLKLKETRTLFRKEQHFPSSIIDRGGDPNAPDILSRARQRVDELLQSYRPPAIPADSAAKDKP